MSRHNPASAQVQQVTFQGLLAGYRVSQAMSTQCKAISADLSLQQLVDEQTERPYLPVPYRDTPHSPLSAPLRAV